MIRVSRAVPMLMALAGCFVALMLWFSCRSETEAQAPSDLAEPTEPAVETAADTTAAHIESVRDMLAREPALPSLRVELAQAYREAYELNGDEAARRELLTALSLQPDDYGALYELGQTLYALRRYLAAAVWFDRASAGSRDDWRPWYRAGLAYLRASRDGQAVDRLREAVRLAPSEVGPRRAAAEVSCRQSLLDEARIHLEWLSTHEPSAEDRTWARSKLLLLDLAEGRYRGPAWDQADPPGIGPLKLRTNEAFERGQSTPDPVAQVAAYEEAISLDPGMYQAPNNLGLALMELHEYERAISYFKQADELYRINTPDGEMKLDAQCNIALCYNRSGHSEDAMGYVDLVLEVEPDFVQGLYASGEVLLGLGRSQEALDPLTRCMQIEPEHADAARLLGAAYADLDETDLAVAMLKYSAWLTPEEADRGLIEQDIAMLESGEPHASQTTQPNTGPPQTE